MKIIIIGASGIIGREIVGLLAQTHEIIQAHRQAQFDVDIASKLSIQKLFERVRPFDAVICAAGVARFGPLDQLSDGDFALGLDSKLMGQVNLVRVGINYISDYGSFTLTTGRLAHSPVPGSASISMINAGLEGFVRSAALELPRNIRLNAVSPPWTKETLKTMGWDPSPGLPASQVALAYQESVEGNQSGEILEVKEVEELLV